ncbi:MAG: IS3 family transposase [Nitrospirota bacterium]
MLCSIGRVSRSGYYRRRLNSAKPAKDFPDYLLVKEIFDKGKGRYGWRTIQMRLARNRVVMNHKKIIRIMKKYHLTAKIRRANPYRLHVRQMHEHRTFDNKLNREFKPGAPFKTFCTDITYLPFKRQIAYLSAIKDIGSGEIVGWNLSQHLERELVTGSFEQMENNNLLPLQSFRDILIHSDQGLHYTNSTYVRLLRNLRMIQSMSRRGNCLDNAPMESFFGHLKDDVDYRGCKTFEELRLLIGEYMRYYNHERQQWNLKKMTPVEYRNHLLGNTT